MESTYPITHKAKYDQHKAELFDELERLDKKIETEGEYIRAVCMAGGQPKVAYYNKLNNMKDKLEGRLLNLLNNVVVKRRFDEL